MDRAMNLNGYSWVEGNTPNMIDPSGKCSAVLLQLSSNLVEQINSSCLGAGEPQSPPRQNPCAAAGFSINRHCANQASPCDNWGAPMKSRCQQLENDPEFTNLLTVQTALAIFSLLALQASLPIVGRGGPQFQRSMEHYINPSEKGTPLLYDGSSWYGEDTYYREHQDLLLHGFSQIIQDGNWGIGGVRQGIDEPVCGSVFVDNPPPNNSANSNDVHFTLGRHTLNACAQRTSDNKFHAIFAIRDTFDFNPRDCIALIGSTERFGIDSVSPNSLNRIGCVPQVWWVKLVEKGVAAPFNQLVLWERRDVSLDTEFASSLSTPITALDFSSFVQRVGDFYQEFNN